VIDIPTEIPLRDRVDPEAVKPGQLARQWVAMIEEARADPVAVPVVIARGGRGDGPVLGVTAAVHGNELNGIGVIHRLLRALDPSAIAGTVLAVPVVNMPAFLDHDRFHGEGWDLNRMMPGRPDGHTGEVYAHRFLERIACHFDYLIDLHTASFGRVNSLYVRVNLDIAAAAQIARLVSPEIIVHNPAKDGTLRGEMTDRGVPAITLEVGNPHRFQRRLIQDSHEGILRVMTELGMIEKSRTAAEEDGEPVMCERSYWIYAQHGGLLHVLPELAESVAAGEVIARGTDLFGQRIAEYRAPEPGVVVGKSTNPVCRVGSRVLHLGVVRGARG
jgi:hypothetical protein